jgi:hypothetical protein
VHQIAKRTTAPMFFHFVATCGALRYVRNAALLWPLSEESRTWAILAQS